MANYCGLLLNTLTAFINFTDFGQANTVDGRFEDHKYELHLVIVQYCIFNRLPPRAISSIFPGNRQTNRVRMTRITEQPSNYRHLEKMSIDELTRHINNEDKTVALAVEKALPQLNALIAAVVKSLRQQGRVFYLGAGSGGRLSVLDAIELPTTYGIDPGIFQPILAGGVEHLVAAREEKEDDQNAGWAMLQERKISAKDIVIGISASGTTPFVLSALIQCRAHGIPTACIVSNPGAPIAAQADWPVEVITGPEFITGSTRMKCGTAQKMLFDIISTTSMVQMGQVEDNQMVNVKLINNKITDRAVKMLMAKSGLTDYATAKEILLQHGSVRKAMDHLASSVH